MAKYMIHAAPERMWYVNDYLIPSMLKQGIDILDISMYVDEKHEGCLKSCMKAFMLCEEENGGTWHLQDDVIISRNFKEQTEKYDIGIVCGFSSLYDEGQAPGDVNVRQMWFSFPCIRIPNAIAYGCGDWVLKYMIGNPVYKDWWKNGSNDDLMFRQYVWQYHPDSRAYNLAPNIVDHIDYLIGGTINKERLHPRIIRSKFWKDEDLVEELSAKLQSNNTKNVI